MPTNLAKKRARSSMEKAPLSKPADIGRMSPSASMARLLSHRNEKAHKLSLPDGCPGSRSSDARLNEGSQPPGDVSTGGSPSAGLEPSTPLAVPRPIAIDAHSEAQSRQRSFAQTLSSSQSPGRAEPPAHAGRPDEIEVIDLMDL